VAPAELGTPKRRRRPRLLNARWDKSVRRLDQTGQWGQTYMASGQRLCTRAVMEQKKEPWVLWVGKVSMESGSWKKCRLLEESAHLLMLASCKWRQAYLGLPVV
jgi:hypothetical protein